MNSPATEYAKRKEARLGERAERERVHRRIGNLKALAMAMGLVMAWFSLVRGAFSGYWLAAPVGVYLALALWHELTLRARSRAEHAAAFYERGLARIEDRWSGAGATGERFKDAKHVYAEDLDLFGNGGLFQLLCSTQTAMGEERLAEWLLRASPVKEIRERQKTVGELRQELNLRERAALLSADLEGTLEPKRMEEWAEGETKLASETLRTVVAGLAILEVAAVVWWATTGEYGPFLILLAVNAGVYTWLRKRAEAAISGIGANEDGLLIFSKILALIAQRKFASGKLTNFGGEGKAESRGASGAMKRLAHIVNWIDARDSLLMKLLEVPLLYTIQTGFAADGWRKKCGRHVREWIDAAAEFEALLSISAYGYEHPEDPFPEFLETANGQTTFSGEELGHPLIAAARCVRNSVHVGGETRVLLVSGSNMSGKSTLLRTVGVNFVLAMAGAPVRAKSLRFSPVALGTRIRSTDSLQEARSNFYTEILRIRQAAALAEENRVLFLFDELLEGTNSHDRQVGAEGLLRTLVERGAIGIVTTHDLALTKITSLDGKMRNVHFEDQIVEGEMVFDYKLREGVVPKSNALDLMRWIGLKV